MDASLKYRTQGSLPIGPQSHSQYIPRAPEPRPANHSKPPKQAPAPPQRPSTEERRTPPPVPPKPSSEARQGPPKPPAEVQQVPQKPPAEAQNEVRPAAPKLEPYKPRVTPFDPCHAIIGNSPYYIYFQMVTQNGCGPTPGAEDIRDTLERMVVVDKDIPRTAKYRNFCAKPPQ